MKKAITLTLLTIMFLILDNTLIPMLSIKGYFPSLLLVFVISYSVINGTKEAIIIGSLSGLLQDVYFINGLGINAFTNLIVCVLAAEIGKSIIRKKAIIPVISMFILSILKGILLFAILYIIGVYTKSRIILYTSVYNTIVAIFMYKPIFKLCQKEYMKQNWRF